MDRPIVYVVVVDGLDGDAVDGGAAPFLGSMIEGRDAFTTYFEESRAVMIAETNPNHTAMMTGAYGEDSGIPGNSFALYAPIENEDSCRATGARDESKAPSPTSGENQNCPVAQMVFESILRQGNSDGLLTAAVFGKPKLGRIFATRRVSPGRRDVDHLWAPCSSGDDDDEYCASVPTNPVSGYATDDGTVMNEVLRTIDEGVGEARRRPDFTFVNLHQVDSAGHAFTVGAAYSEAIGMADGELRRLVDKLKERGEWERTVLIVLSDHSMDTTLTKTNITGVFEDAGIPADSFVALHNGSVDSVFLADRTAPGRFELLKRMRAAALATGRVQEALYRDPNPADGGGANTIDGVHPAWHAAGTRSPDLFLTHKPGGAFSDPSESSNPVPGSHGASHTRDNFFAVTGGAPFVKHARLSGSKAPDFDDTLVNPQQAENVDVAPTVMGLFGLAAPRNNAGRFLRNALDMARLPGGGRPTGRPVLSVSVRSRGERTCGVRLGWGDNEGVYDLQVKRGARRFRTVLRNDRRLSRSVRLRRRALYRFRVRKESASGAHSAWDRRAVRCR